MDLIQDSLIERTRAISSSNLLELGTLVTRIPSTPQREDLGPPAGRCGNHHRRGRNSGKLLQILADTECEHFDRDYFKVLKDDVSLDRAIGEPVQNRGTGTWTIYNARKIRMQDGSFGGMVLVAVELSYFERFFQSIATGDGRAINLFRADGTLLARFPRVPHSVGKQMSNSQLFGALLLRENSGVVKQRSNIDGFERLIAAKKVVGFPLVVTVADTVDAALSRWRSDANAIALLTCLLEILRLQFIFYVAAAIRCKAIR